MYHGIYVSFSDSFLSIFLLFYLLKALKALLLPDGTYLFFFAPLPRIDKGGGLFGNAGIGNCGSGGKVESVLK